MKAIILAAGRGSRLHPYTAECPKCLTELGGLTLIDRQIRTLRAAGITDILIATGYRDAMLRLPGTRQVHNADWQTTNMVETLFSAEAEFGDDLIVGYSDIVYEPRVLDALLAAEHDIGVVVDRHWLDLWQLRFDDPLSDAESLRMDPAGRITDIGNPPDRIADIEAQYIGLMRFRGNGIAALRHSYANLHSAERPWMERRPRQKAYMTDLLMEMVLLGYHVYAAQIAGGWLEIDTVRDYETAVAMIGDGSMEPFFDPAATPAAT